MINQKKIVFTDLDGTLLDDYGQISAKNKAAIDGALSTGHNMVIATGRPIASAKLLARELGLMKEGCYVIASNGALIYDCHKQSILYEASIPKRYIRPLLDSAYEENIHIHTYSKTNVLSERDTKEVRWYEKCIRVPALIVDDVTDYLTYDPIKVLLIHFDNKQKLLDFQEKMEEPCLGKVDSIFSNDIMLEYCPLGVSKGKAVSDLCKLLDIPIEHSIAAGDAQNDISMMEAAGISCVMCNGSDETKAHADYITVSDNNHDGFAEIIEKFLL